MKVNKNYIDSFYEYGLWLEGRTIYIPCLNHEEGVSDDEITTRSAERVLKHLALLETKSDPIKVILNSPGGDLYHGFAIYDALKRSPCQIEITATGQCQSMASIILQAGNKRKMSESCVMMVHQGSEELSGHPEDVKNWGRINNWLTNKMYQIYSGASGKPVKYWERKCQKDYILTPNQAKEEGLVDEII